MKTNITQYQCKIGIKLPFYKHIKVPILVNFIESTGEYEIIGIEYVPIPGKRPKPDWGNMFSELGWLQRHAFPELWGQVAFQIQEQRINQ